MNNSVNKLFEYIQKSEDLTPRQIRMLKDVNVLGVYGSDVVLQVNNEEIRYLLESQIQSVILDILKKIYSSSISSFVVKIDNTFNSSEPFVNKDAVSPVVTETIVYPKIEKKDLFSSFENNVDKLKTFESFVPGECNKLAYAASVAVSESPGNAMYNPLYIYGSPGLGKTHLLYAIANAAETINRALKIYYTSAENFLNDYVEASIKNKAQQFQKMYRSLDILLIDDIQFLGMGGREKTADVFFHIFNELITKKKQIVIASDVEPDKLKGLDKRMSQRFKGSVYWGIDAPDYKMRVSFVSFFIKEKKFVYNNGEKIIFTDYIIQKLCSFIDSSIRELEGVIYNIVSYCSINNETLSESVLDKILKDFVINNHREVDILKITKECAKYFGTTEKEIRNKQRTPKITKARACAMYLSRKITDMTLVQIANFFNKDHTAVIYAEKKIKNEILEKKETEQQINEILKKLR